MNVSCSNLGITRPKQSRLSGGIGVVLLILIAVAALAVVGLLLVRSSGGSSGASETPKLSAHTIKVLQSLRAPVDLRFYSLLEVDSVDPALPAFAGRARRFLEAFQAVVPGKLSLHVFDTASETNLASAATDGLRAFNLEKGAASYLGLAIQSGSHKRTVPLLSPEYEAALESDVVRAIAAVDEAVKTSRPVTQPEELPVAGPDDLKAALPDVATVSLETGTRRLREQMNEALLKNGREHEARLAELETLLKRARESGSAAEQEEARKAVAEAERANVKRMQSIMTETMARIRALEQVKSQ